MRIIVTGAYEWIDRDTIEFAIKKHTNRNHRDQTEIIHNGCMGAAKIADEVAKSLKIKTTVFEPNWIERGKGAALVTNIAMVQSGADICLAFPLDEESGTVKHCMWEAHRRGIEVIDYGCFGT